MVPFLLITFVLVAGPLLGYVQLRLPFTDESQWLWLAGLAMDFCVVGMGLFQSGRRIAAGDESLVCQSWFGRRELRLTAITDLSFRQETPSGPEGYQHTFHYITVYGREEELIRFNIDYWDRAGLKTMLRNLIQRYPSINVDREVKDYLREA
ncbi:MAG: hypothetical protein ACRES4_08860 [Nevskiales bacterium]